MRFTIGRRFSSWIPTMSLPIWASVVYSFSRETGDENKIHLTDHPVVQGMLLVRTAACKQEELTRLDVKFTEPCYAEEELYWGFNGRENVLYADGYVKASFKIK